MPNGPHTVFGIIQEWIECRCQRDLRERLRWIETEEEVFGEDFGVKRRVHKAEGRKSDNRTRKPKRRRQKREKH